MIIDVALRDPTACGAKIFQSEKRGARIAMLLGWSILTSTLFGASVGAYVGKEQIFFAAIKMPLLFVGTLLLSFPMMYLFAFSTAGLSGAGMLFEMSLISITVTTTCLSAFAPIMLLLSLSIPIPSYPGYLFLVLLMVFLIAFAGVIGVVQLYRGLRRYVEPRHLVRLTLFWFMIYHFVGGQMAWLLRPFVGHTFEVRGVFSIWRYFEGNIYEAVFKVIRNLLNV